jgi:predicted metal-dependent hydrolase
VSYHPLYIQFFRHYHREQYWEAHEVLEELWQTQRDNDFYHGLIQVAAIMHQLKLGKVRGARKLASTALKYLKPYIPKHDGVDVAKVIQWLEHCLAVLPKEISILEPEEMEKLAIPSCPLPRL